MHLSPIQRDKFSENNNIVSKMKTNRIIQATNKIVRRQNRIGIVFLFFVIMQMFSLIFTEQNVCAQAKRQGFFNFNKQTQIKPKNNGTAASSRQSFDDLSKASTSRENANEAIRKIPWNLLEAKSREKIESLIRDHTIYRRLPMSGGFCNPEMFDFLLCHPDVVVALWEVLGYAQISLKELAPNYFYLKESAGTAGHVQVLYHDNELLIAHCNGVYQGPLIPRPLEGEIVIILQIRYTEDQKMEPIAICRMDSFIRVKNIGADLMGRVFQPLIGKVADMNFEQTIDFVNGISKTAEENPARLQDLIQQSTKISSETKQAFLQTVDRVGNQYYSRANGEVIAYQLQSKQNQPLGGNARILSRKENQAANLPTAQTGIVTNKTSNNLINKPVKDKMANEVAELVSMQNQNQQRIAKSGTFSRSSNAATKELTSPELFAPSALSNQDVFSSIDFSLSDSNNSNPLTGSTNEIPRNAKPIDERTVSTIPPLSVEQINPNRIDIIPQLSLKLNSISKEATSDKQSESKVLIHRPLPLNLSNNRPLSIHNNNPQPLQIQKTEDSKNEESSDPEDDFALNVSESNANAKNPIVLLHQFDKTARQFGSSASSVNVQKVSPLSSAKKDQEEVSEFTLALPPLDNISNDNALDSSQVLDINEEKTNDISQDNQWNGRISKNNSIPSIKKETQKTVMTRNATESESHWTPVPSTTSNLAMQTNDVSLAEKKSESNLNVLDQSPSVTKKSTAEKKDSNNSSSSLIFKKPVLR